VSAAPGVVIVSVNIVYVLDCQLDDARQRIQQDIGETGHFMFAGSPDPMLYSMPSGVNDVLRQGGVDGHFTGDSPKAYQVTTIVMIMSQHFAVVIIISWQLH